MNRYSMALQKFSFPEYVKIEGFGAHGSTLRYIPESNGQYWRDAGAWGFQVKLVKGELYVDDLDLDSHLSHIKGAHLVEVGERIWREDNGSYAPVKKSSTWQERLESEIPF